MRRFKCQVDLDENYLVFGGKDGVKEPFLPQQEAMIVAQTMMTMQDDHEPNPSSIQGVVQQQQTGGSDGGGGKAGPGGLLKSIFKR